MLFAKCKCGSLYTLSENIIGKDKWIYCPGCSSKVHVNAADSVFGIMAELQSTGVDVQRLPDSTEITFSFGA